MSDSEIRGLNPACRSAHAGYGLHRVVRITGMTGRFFTCQTANASPARSIGRDREAHRGRFFLRPLANEGVERREALGAGSARTLACPTGHAGTPDEASRAQ